MYPIRPNPLMNQYHGLDQSLLTFCVVHYQVDILPKSIRIFDGIPDIVASLNHLLVKRAWILGSYIIDHFDQLEW